MVETAQNSKAPGQKIADRFASYLVIVAVGGGFLTFTVWYFIIGEPIMLALTFAISTVVIACPDALGLATPTAVAVGTGLGAKHNILIKDAPTLEEVSRIQAVVMDKTGTLTEGKPKITDVVAAGGFSADEIIRLDAAAEAKSSHPLSLAVLEEAKRRKVNVSTKVEKFKNLAGHGVEAVVDRKHILVGTLKLMNDWKVDILPIKKEIDKLLSEGKTIMILAVDKKVAGVAAASDPVKENAKKAVLRMKELGLEVAMITGDNKKTAEAIGKEISIDRIFAEVLPEDKEKYVKKLQDEGKFVAMVGDGVNDAPALASSDVGIAMGTGTDVAIEAAGITLVNKNLMSVVSAIKLSKQTMKTIKLNLFWAFAYNVILIPVAMMGWISPILASGAMAISSISVVTNSLLLKKAKI